MQDNGCLNCIEQPKGITYRDGDWDCEGCGYSLYLFEEV